MTSRPMNEFGDKECYHLNTDGHLYYFDHHVPIAAVLNASWDTSYFPCLKDYRYLDRPLPVCYYWAGLSSSTCYAQGGEGHETLHFDRSIKNLLVINQNRSYGKQPLLRTITVEISPTYSDAGELVTLRFDITSIIRIGTYLGTYSRTQTAQVPTGPPSGVYQGALITLVSGSPQASDLPADPIVDWKLRSLEGRIRADLASLPINSEERWGDIALQCVQQQRSLTDNEFANVMDLVDLALFDPSDLFEVSGKGAASLVSGAYLSEHYGLENNIRDIGSIINADYRKQTAYKRNALIARAMGSETNSGKLGDSSGWYTEYHLKHYYRPPTDFMEFLAYFAWAHGFSPSLSTIWDLIPFSFVVDWAVNVGENFDRLDSAYFLSKTKTISVVKSTKSTTSIPADVMDIRWSGILTVSAYRRQILGTLPPMPLGLNVTAPSPDHFWEGASLLISQRRR
jgi:hypothetical protein